MPPCSLLELICPIISQTKQVSKQQTGSMTVSPHLIVLLPVSSVFSISAHVAWFLSQKSDRRTSTESSVCWTEVNTRSSSSTSSHVICMRWSNLSKSDYTTKCCFWLAKWLWRMLEVSENTRKAHQPTTRTLQTQQRETHSRYFTVPVLRGSPSSHVDSSLILASAWEWKVIWLFSCLLLFVLWSSSVVMVLPAPLESAQTRGIHHFQVLVTLHLLQWLSEDHTCLFYSRVFNIY